MIVAVSRKHRTKPIARVLAIGTLRLRRNRGGIEWANEPDFRPAGVSGVGRGAREWWPVAGGSEGGSRRQSESAGSKPTEAKGQRSKTAGCRITETRGSRHQLGGVTGNHSSGLCLSGRERISIVLLSFGGASWMVSGSVRVGVNARHPDPGRGPYLPRQVRSRQGRCLALHGPSRIEDIRTTAQGVRTVDEDWRLAHSCRYPGLDRFDRAEHAECGRA